MPADLADYLLHWLPPWLDTCLDARMYDLSCELLAVAASLPRPPEPAVLEDAWQRVAAAQDSSGAIPEEGAARDAAGPDPGPDPYDFTDCYHSTLMAAFAAALGTAAAARAPDRRFAARHEAQPAGQGAPG